jgi:hypothetical protein
LYKTDLSAMPIFMQSQIPDCVENGVTYVKEYHDFKNKGTVVALSRRSLAIPTVAADGVPFDQGTSLQVALNVASKKGIAESSLFSDDHTLSETAFIDAVIPPEAVTNALTHTIESYVFVQDKSANGLKNAIYQNGLVLLGMYIDDAWWTSVTGQTSWFNKDILPLRPVSANSTTKSGHCIALYGYDETYFYLVNWWSDQWASTETPEGGLGTDGGFGYFGVNDLPEIYEAATIVDLTEEQIQQQINAVQQEINNVNPQSSTLAEQEQKLEQVVEDIGQELKDVI